MYSYRAWFSCFQRTPLAELIYLHCSRVVTLNVPLNFTMTWYRLNFLVLWQANSGSFRIYKSPERSDRGREQCCINHCCSWTGSMKPSLVYISWVISVLPKEQIFRTYLHDVPIYPNYFWLLRHKNIIRIFNGCEVRIENSFTRVTVRHHEACRVKPNSYPEWRAPIYDTYWPPGIRRKYPERVNSRKTLSGMQEISVLPSNIYIFHECWGWG